MVVVSDLDPYFLLLSDFLIRCIGTLNTAILEEEQLHVIQSQNNIVMISVSIDAMIGMTITLFQMPFPQQCSFYYSICLLIEWKIKLFLLARDILKFSVVV